MMVDSEGYVAKNIQELDIKRDIVFPRNLSVFTIEKSDNYSSLVSRKSVLLLRSFFAWGYCDNQRYLKIYGFPTKHKPFYDSWKGIFVDKNALMYERKKASKDLDYLKKIAEKCQADGEKIWRYSLNIKRENLATKTDEQLKEIAKEGMEGLVNLSAYLLVPLSLQEFFEESIKHRLSKSIKDKKVIKKYFEILTTPSKQNVGYFEQVAILKLAKHYKKTKKIHNLQMEIEKYLFEFDSLGVKYGVGKRWTKKDIFERVSYLSKQKPEKRLESILPTQKRYNKEVKKVLSTIEADKYFKKLVKITRLYVYLRTYRTDIISGAFANMFPLFDEIGKRNNLEVEFIIECLPNEILNFRFPRKESIIERAKSSMIRGINGKLYYAFGKKAVQIRKNLLKKVDKDLTKENYVANIDEIKGDIASRGLVRGVVKIVLDNSELKKINEGDILVSPMTTPDFIPAMEKASAFVTDEGGILCHAAIVSREMQKPCIISTRNATHILKDGDFVEVDAHKGTVKIIKEITKNNSLFSQKEPFPKR